MQESKDALRRNSRAILHSALQGRLASISLAIQLHLDSEGANKKAGFEELRRRLESLIELANQDLVDLLAGGKKSPKGTAETFVAISSQWVGLIDVTIEAADQVIELIDSHPSLQENLREVLQDLINNANRHGQARSVILSVSEGMDRENNAALVVTAVDDGSSSSSSGEPGQGFKNVEELGGAWSITKPSRGGALVTVNLPL
jgi:signal transduction histidine kinase